jgi:serine/threonine protein kinase
MNWVRGHTLGSGSFATVHLAKHTKDFGNFPSLSAVKSCNLDNCFSLQNEKHILDQLGSSPHIIKCFGHDQTFENDQEYYNIFLEYAAGGTLNDQLYNYGGKFTEKHVRRYTRSIVEGLKYIHENGFVHCDLKLPNILVFDDDNIKISDFGLAKEKGLVDKQQCRGTPMYMSPEAINDNVHESPADIWALGCAVVEMITGEPVWKNETDMWMLFTRIVIREEQPFIPDELSQEGKDFLDKCFARDPLKRWSADMLLKHPFISEDETVSSLKVFTNELLLSSSSSPKTHFDYPRWASSTITTLCTSSGEWIGMEFKHCFCSQEMTFHHLVTDQTPLN